MSTLWDVSSFSLSEKVLVRSLGWIGLRSVDFMSFKMLEKVLRTPVLCPPSLHQNTEIGGVGVGTVHPRIQPVTYIRVQPMGLIRIIPLSR